jgi:hypothetical protein
LNIDWRINIHEPSQIPERLNAYSAKHQPSECARSGSRRSLASTCSLEHIAAIVGVKFHCARQVGVAWSRPMHWRRSLEVIESRVLIGHLQHNRCASGQPKADPRGDLNVIGLDALPTAAAVATLASSQLGINEVNVDRKPRGHSSDQRRATWAMRFASSLNM